MTMGQTCGARIATCSFFCGASPSLWASPSPFASGSQYKKIAEESVNHPRHPPNVRSPQRNFTTLSCIITFGPNEDANVQGQNRAE